MLIFKVVTGLSEFKTRFEEYQRESLLRGGTGNEVNQQIEWQADFVGALVFGAASVGISEVGEKLLKNYGDIMGFNVDLSKMAANDAREYVRNRLYENRDDFEDNKEKDLIEAERQSFVYKITYELKEAGFELGGYTESLYKYLEEFIKSTIKSQQNKYESWQSLTPEEQAYWISAGGTPWNYNINTLLDELNNKDLNIIDKIKELLKQASTISSPLVLDINKDGTINTTWT